MPRKPWLRCGSDRCSRQWDCHTFPHRLALELKAGLRDAIQEKRTRAEDQCLDWWAQEERVVTSNPKLGDLWVIPLNLEHGELRFREWSRYLQRNQRLLKQVEYWSE